MFSKWSISQLTVGFDVWPLRHPERSVGQGRGRDLTLGLQSLQELLKSGAVEFPVEWTRLLITQFLIQSETLLDLLKTGEIVGGQNLPLDDREVDLHLIQPTRMHRRVNQYGLTISVPEALYRRLATVRRAIIHNPEDPARRAVRFHSHDLLHQSAERLDLRLRLATAQDSATANIPGGQVLKGSASLVFMLNAHRPPRAGRQGRVATDSGLNARFLIRTDDVVATTQRFAFPEAGIQIEDSPGRPAFSENFGSRGKIQYSYRQGLIASVSRIRQTVLGLIGRPKAEEARSARSDVESRLSGCLDWQTASHAIALTSARSQGGKSGLSSTARPIAQRKVTASPAVSPEADRIGVQFHRGPSRGVGDLRRLVKQEGQSSPLVLSVRGRPPADKDPTEFKKLDWKRGTVLSGGARHGVTPFPMSDRPSDRMPRE